MTCYSVEDHRFWAYTWKQKLFSMSQGSTWAFDIWLVTYDMQQCDMRDVKVWETVTFFACSWRTMMFSMSQGSTKRVTCGMWQPDELPHENKSCWVCQKQHLAFGIFQRDKRRCQNTSIVIFAYELWVFSLDMKTKVVSHVPRSIWHITVWQKNPFSVMGNHYLIQIRWSNGSQRSSTRGLETLQCGSSGGRCWRT